MIPVSRNIRAFFTKPGCNYTRRIIVGIIFFVLYLFVLAADFMPGRVTLQEGQVSDRDIVAPRTVSYINSEKTQNLENEVASNVPRAYDHDTGVIQTADTSIANIFSTVKTMENDTQLSAEERIARLKALFAAASIQLPDNVIASLASLNKEYLDKANEQVRLIIHKYLERGVRENELEATRREIGVDVAKLNLTPDLENSVRGVSQAVLQPNFVLNTRETENRLKTALAAVEPVRETVLQGQILVRRGDVVSAEQIRIMGELGLYGGQISDWRFLGMAVYVLLVLAVFLGYLYRLDRPVFNSDKQLILIGFIILINLLLAKAAHYYSDFLAPLAIGALLMAILINVRVALFGGTVIAILFSIVADQGLRVVLMALASGVTGIYSVAKLLHGYSLTRTGLLMAVVNFVVIVSTGLVFQSGHEHYLAEGGLGLVSGLGSAIITIGILPYLEHAFNITTSATLIDLSKPNNPLLKRLLLDAPGTYYHSILVGNLAESAADAIGADPVIARVGAYYHDIGKIERPYFFTENQSGNYNPHCNIAPSLSANIIISHVKEGVELCRKYALPAVIEDIARQHHGTTLVAYFYHQATVVEQRDDVCEDDFRYPGPKPQTREAALIMLADSCEAAVRAGAGSSNFIGVEPLVRKLIKQRLQDGQLDDSDLTLRDIHTIGDIYVRILTSMFSKRIEYPDMDKDRKER